MTMQQYELDAWLGDDWTPEQRNRIAADFRTWESAHPDADDDESGDILTAIAQLHDRTLEVPNLTEARRAAQAGAVVMVTFGGVSESEAARRAGVDRMTVRSWLGKRKR